MQFHLCVLISLVLSCGLEGGRIQSSFGKICYLLLLYFSLLWMFRALLLLLDWRLMEHNCKGCKQVSTVLFITPPHDLFRPIPATRADGFSSCFAVGRGDCGRRCFNFSVFSILHIFPLPCSGFKILLVMEFLVGKRLQRASLWGLVLCERLWWSLGLVDKLSWLN